MKAKPQKDKVYVVLLRADRLTRPTRTLATRQYGRWHLLREGCSRDNEDVVDYWLLPPNGEPLGEDEHGELLP